MEDIEQEYMRNLGHPKKEESKGLLGDIYQNTVGVSISLAYALVVFGALGFLPTNAVSYENTKELLNKHQSKPLVEMIRDQEWRDYFDTERSHTQEFFYHIVPLYTKIGEQLAYINHNFPE